MFDIRGNLVDVTLFESKLSHFMMTHTVFYKEVYLKLLSQLELFLNQNRLKDPQAERAYFSIFTAVNEQYSNPDKGIPVYRTFEDIKKHFYLPVVEFFIKNLADYLLKVKPGDEFKDSPTQKNILNLYKISFFPKPSIAELQDVSSKIRRHLVFNESARGVRDAPSPTHEGHLEEQNMHLGIVDDKYTPSELKNFFPVAFRKVAKDYITDEDSHVALWLRARNLPVIAGTSGSTELMINRVFPLVNLSEEEQKLVIFVQSLNLIAHGCHSFFECMLVLKEMGMPLQDKKTMIEFYEQCIPPSILHDNLFDEFWTSKELRHLLEDAQAFVASQETISLKSIGPFSKN